MKKLFLTCIFLLSYILLFAQISADTKKNLSIDSIKVLNVSNGLMFMKNGSVLDYKELENTLSRNYNTAFELDRSKTDRTAATSFAIGGCSFLLLSAITFLKYEKDLSRTNLLTASYPTYNMMPLYVGLGAFAVSIPLTIGVKVHLKKAIKIYNNTLSGKSQQTSNKTRE